MAAVAQEIQTIFTAVDLDGSGHIDATELQAALGKSGFVLSLTTIAQLIRLHDRHNDGRIDFQEFTALYNFLGEAQAVFHKAGGGSADVKKISSTQLKGALASLGRLFLFLLLLQSLANFCIITATKQTIIASPQFYPKFCLFLAVCRCWL